MKDLMNEGHENVLTFPSGDRNAAHIRRSQRTRELVRDWKQTDGWRDAGGDIAVGLKNYFAFSLRNAEGDR